MKEIAIVALGVFAAYLFGWIVFNIDGERGPHEVPMELKCQCCGIEQNFKDADAAFEAGWDAPPHFTGYIACNLCPAACIILAKGHAKAHALWAKQGRPADFAIATCACDDVFGDAIKVAEAEHASEDATALIDEFKRLADGLTKTKL